MTNEDFGLQYRPAEPDDLPALVALLTDDILGRERERLDAAATAQYQAAFRAIQAQPGNQILLGILGGEIVAMLQLTFIPGLSHRGATRAQVESVRVRRSFRGRGIGQSLFRQAIELSRQTGCRLVQLTTDQRRPDALRFYERLGFEATHFGMKLAI